MKNVCVVHVRISLHYAINFVRHRIPAVQTVKIASTAPMDNNQSSADSDRVPPIVEAARASREAVSGHVFSRALPDEDNAINRSTQMTIFDDSEHWTLTDFSDYLKGNSETAKWLVERMGHECMYDQDNNTWYYLDSDTMLWTRSKSRAVQLMCNARIRLIKSAQAQYLSIRSRAMSDTTRSTLETRY
jgi:hypothetical protein